MEQQKTKWIKLWTVTRANEDMKGWSWKEINWVRYYTFSEAIETAKQQWLTLPTKQDFLDSWFTEERSKENKKLADKLWFTLDGYCNSDGRLDYKGIYGFRWSASPKVYNNARNFRFIGDEGDFNRFDRSYALPVRCLYKNIEEQKHIPWLENYQASTLLTAVKGVDELEAQLNQAQNNAEIWTAIWAIYDYLKQTPVTSEEWVQWKCKICWKEWMYLETDNMMCDSCWGKPSKQVGWMLQPWEYMRDNEWNITTYEDEQKETLKDSQPKEVERCKKCGLIITACRCNMKYMDFRL